MAILDTTRTTFGTTGIFGRIRAVLTVVGLALTVWRDNRSTKRALYALSDRELNDIGLSRDEIQTLIK